MGRPEASVEQYLKRRVLEEGGRVRKLVWQGHRGAPDRFVWWPGPRMAFVECKSATGRVDRMQQYEMSRLAADGFQVHVVRTREGVDAMIAEVKGSTS